MEDDELESRSEAYLDELFGSGMGRRHTGFLDRIKSPTLRETLHRYHLMESDETQLSIEENYLVGLCVLCALGRHAPASMFAKTLVHLGTAPAKILEAVARLSMWIGGVPAAEATAHIQKAIREYEREGLASMAGWFPADDGEGDR